MRRSGLGWLMGFAAASAVFPGARTSSAIAQMVSRESTESLAPVSKWQALIEGPGRDVPLTAGLYAIQPQGPGGFLILGCFEPSGFPTPGTSESLDFAMTLRLDGSVARNEVFDRTGCQYGLVVPAADGGARLVSYEDMAIRIGPSGDVR